MSEHYYSAKPTVKHDERTFQETLRGRSFTWTTDAGVFSKTGVDFGSRVLIDALQLRPDERVLDVGCGYGPIGLAAATLVPDGHVVMLDINERAVELARANAVRNGIHHVEVLVSDALDAVKGRTFTSVLTNPPIRAGKATVFRIYEEAHQVLEPGGSLWVVIQKKQGAPSTWARLEELFAEVEEVTKEKGYRIFRAIR